jgi:hypothetical protein
MRKILFLDHDGVICMEKQWGTRYDKQQKLMDENKDWIRPPMREIPIYSRFDDFDGDCIDVLNQVLLETDCQIVTSSDWTQWATVEEMGDYYESQGIIVRPIDFIETINANDVHLNHRDTVREELRVIGIKKWLERNPDVTHWVAVDDLNLGITEQSYMSEWERDWGIPNFVRTRGWSWGIDENGIKEEIVKFLNG